jgi:hypothetical protein
MMDRLESEVGLHPCRRIPHVLRRQVSPVLRPLRRLRGRSKRPGGGRYRGLTDLSRSKRLVGSLTRPQFQWAGLCLILFEGTGRRTWSFRQIVAALSQASGQD